MHKTKQLRHPNKTDWKKYGILENVYNSVNSRGAVDIQAGKK